MVKSIAQAKNTSRQINIGQGAKMLNMSISNVALFKVKYNTRVNPSLKVIHATLICIM